MTKIEFLSTLREALSTLSRGDVERSVEFYEEMIDDRMEDGMSEAEAVANMGDLTRIAQQILSQAQAQATVRAEGKISADAKAPADAQTAAEISAATETSVATEAPVAVEAQGQGPQGKGACDGASDGVCDGGVPSFRYVLRNPWVVGFLSPFLLILWAVAFSVLTALWCVAVAFYAVGVALAISGVALHVAGTALFFAGISGEGLLVFGAGAFLVGFTVLWFLGCKYFALAMVKLTKWTFWALTVMILRKEGSV